MPWKLQKKDTGYVVVDDKGHEYSKKPLPKWQAVNQMRALYANEKKEAPNKGGCPASCFLVVEDPAKTTTWHLQVRDSSGKPDHNLMGAAWAALMSPGGHRGNKYEGPGKDQAISKLRSLYKSEGMTMPGEKSFSVFKQADGQYRWVLISSSAFRDRDGEIVTAKALVEDCDRCDAMKDYGPLRWWHLGSYEFPNGPEDWQTWKAGPGIDIGTCDFNMVHGKMLIESGTFKDAETAEAFSEVQDKLEVSIGFSHPRGEPKDKEYLNIHRFERSLMPVGWASNLLTKTYVTKGKTPMNITQKFDALKAILTGNSDLAQKILADAESIQKAAEVAGLEFKEVQDLVSESAGAETQTAETETPAETPAAETEVISEDVIGNMTKQELQDAIVAVVADQVKSVQEGFATKQAGSDQLLADAVSNLKSFTETLAKFEARLKAAEENAGHTMQKLDDFTDARPVGIKQLMAQRASESTSTVTQKAIAGPTIDETFRHFSTGGK